jgi:hypothetical protein
MIDRIKNCVPPALAHRLAVILYSGGALAAALLAVFDPAERLPWALLALVLANDTIEAFRRER